MKQFNKNKPQNVTFNTKKSGSSIDEEERSGSSSNDEDIELNHSRSNKEPIEPTLGFHSTLINNDMDLELERPPQEDTIDMYEISKIARNWKKIHYSIWKKREEDTNLFFYYFHNFNEKLDVTPFTHDEEEILLITLVQLASSTTSMEKAKNRVKGKWGFISLKIPNRNGLICYQNYLKMRLRRGEFKNDESFLEYLKKKISNEEIVGKIDDTTFLDFFMNLDPGYSNKSEQADFWIKEAARNLKNDEAFDKIKKVEKYLKENRDNSDYCFVPNKELQKKNFELLLVSISNHPYVKINSNKRTPSYSGLKSTQSKETRDTSSKKDENKSSIISKAVTSSRQKPKRLRIEENDDEGLITPDRDRVDRSTDISNPHQEQHGLLIENEGPNKDDDAKITPEPSTSGKVYRNLKTPAPEKKKEKDPTPRKITEEKRQHTLKLMKKYELEFPKKEDVESYDSEPDKRANNKNLKEQPLFFSDISSISSEDENKQSDFLTDGFSALGIQPKGNKIAIEETGTKRKAHQAGIADVKREKKIKASKTIKRNFFEEEIIKSKKPRAKKAQTEPKKKKFRRLKKSENQISTKKKDTFDPTIEDSKEIIKKDVIKYTDRSLFDYADEESSLPKVQSKLDTYLIPKELSKEAEEKRIKNLLTPEHLGEEMADIFSKLENMAEKQINLPRYEINHGYIQDEDKSLESYHCCLLSLQNQLKNYVNNVSSFSLALFGKIDHSNLIMIVRRAGTIFNEVEKDFHRVVKFTSIKESTLKSSGETGILCMKALAQIEQLFIRLFQLEGSSLSFILAVTESGYTLSEEQVIKENLAHILRVYKNITQFFKHIDCFNKVGKQFKLYINENIYLYFLCSMYVKKNSTLIQFPLIEEFAAILLNSTDDREALLHSVSKDLIEKSQNALKSACLSSNDTSTSRSSISDTIFNISKKTSFKVSESALVLLKKKNYAEDKDSSHGDYLVVQFLRYFLRLEFKLHELINDPTFLSNLIKTRFAEFYLLVISNIKLFQHRLNQYILKPVPDMKLPFLDTIPDSLSPIFSFSSTEADFNHSLECVLQIAKRLPLKMPYFMKVYDCVSKTLKPEKQNQSILRLEKIPIEKACQYDYTSINFYLNLAHELHNIGVSQCLKTMGSSRYMVLGLILELCYNNEKTLDETEQEKINRRIASRSISLIKDHGNLDEDGLRDPRILKLFMIDFSLILSIINLSKSSPELLKSSYLKIGNLVNLNKSHRVIKTLVLSLQIDLINYCIQFPELTQKVKDTFETTLNILSILLNEFLEISRLQNHIHKIDNSKGDETDIRLQKLIEQIMLKLRNAIVTNIEFVLENQVNLLPKGLSFLKILNPNNPVTTGLRKEILDYLELILMSKEKVHDIIRLNKGRTSPMGTLSQSPQDEVDFMDDVLDREKKNEIIMHNLVAWRKTALDSGKDILNLLHELIMSVYNKEIMTNIHHRYHVDIFLVEKSLELYSIYSKLLILEGKYNFEDIDKKFGIGSMFYQSKGSKDKILYQNEDRMKGALLSRSNKLSLLLRFYTKFLSFEKDENSQFMKNSHQIKGLENFITDAHLILILASIESVSDISIVQKNFYHDMADFAILASAQGMGNDSSGFNQFLLNAYIERGYQNSEDSRDATEVLKKIFYNLQIALTEAADHEKSNVIKFIDALLTKFVKNLKQDLIEEGMAANGKFFEKIYKNICGLVSQLSNLFAAGGTTKALTELLSLILVDNFNKTNFNLSDDNLLSYDPLLIKLLIKDNILFDFRSFLEAVFSVPKDKHFPRKVFAKLLVFLLKKDIENVGKLKNHPDNAKIKRWELLFKRDLDLTLYSETFLKNLYNCCERSKHSETFLNCIRELVNISLVNSSNHFNIALPLLRCVYPIIKEMDMTKYGGKLIDLFSKVGRLLDQTQYSDEEKISVLYIISYIFKKIPNINENEAYIDSLQVIYSVCFKWMIQIIQLFDENIIEKLQAEGYDFTGIDLGLDEDSGEEPKEINEMQVKIFELCLRIYNESQKHVKVQKPFATELKELIQEKMKINLAMGEGRMSGETKTILQILNEY